MKLPAVPSFAPVLALAALAALAAASDPGSSAGLARRSHLEPRTMTWGSVNLTRDYEVTYNTTHWDALATESKNATTAFCTAWHFMCVDYAEADNRDEHHVIDCSPAQPGPQIYAFCGGVAKNSAGTWTSGETIVDNTAGAMALTNVYASITSGQGASSASSVAASTAASTAASAAAAGASTTWPGQASAATPSTWSSSSSSSSSGDGSSWWSEVFAKHDIAIERD